MLAEERFAAIQELLHKKRAATVTELAQALDASESTIRRDLILLAGQGKLNKVHGGAVAREEAFDFLKGKKLDIFIGECNYPTI